MSLDAQRNVFAASRTVITKVTTPGAAFVELVPANADRVYLIISSDGNAGAAVWPTNPGTNTTGGIALLAGTPFIAMSQNDCAGLCGRNWFGHGAGVTFTVVEEILDRDPCKMGVIG